MKPEKEFIFRIKMPLRHPENDRSSQYFQIVAAYPHYVYSVILKPDERMAEIDQQRLAIAELKVRLIADIAKAEFELEKDT